MKTGIGRRVVFAAAIMVTAFGPRTVWAASYTWQLANNGDSGYYGTSTNWSPTGIPGSTAAWDSAIVDRNNANTYTIILDQDFSAYIMNEVRIRNSGGGQCRLTSVPGGNIYGYAVEVGVGGHLLVTGTGAFIKAGTSGVRIYGGATCSATVTNGGVINSAAQGVQIYSSNNRLTVTGAGSQCNLNQFNLGTQNGNTNNSVQVLAGGYIGTANATIGGELGGTTASGRTDRAYNSVTVSGAGSYLYGSGSLAIGGDGYYYNDSAGDDYNRLTVENGGRIKFSGISLGQWGTNNCNSLNIGGAGASCSATSTTVNIGMKHASGIVGGSSNTVTVSNGTLTCSSTVTIGNGASDNTGIVGAGGTWSATSFTAGSGTAAGNVLRIVNGGIVDANTLVTGEGAGNLITNAGGVYQFTSATPTITTNSNAGGSIFITDGLIAFRDVSSGLNLTNNTNPSALGRMTWSGDNAFRLNNSTATNSVAGGYTFNTGLGPMNYCRLEMVNGTTAVTGGGNPITIGANGTLLFSNTTATLWGAVTNFGTIRFASSAVTFKSGLVMKSGSALAVSSTNSLPMTVNGVLNLEGGTVTLPAGLARDASFTLFTSSNSIAGSVANLAMPPTQRAVLSPDTRSVLVEPRQTGFLFMVD